MFNKKGCFCEQEAIPENVKIYEQLRGLFPSRRAVFSSMQKEIWPFGSPDGATFY